MYRRIADVLVVATFSLIAGCTTFGPLQFDGPLQAGVQALATPPAMTSKPSEVASSTPPKLVPFNETFVWDRPSAFGPVPTALASKGDEVCSALNHKDNNFRATGYHPGAIGEKGVPFRGGGFFCELTLEKPTQIAAVATSPAVQAEPAATLPVPAPPSTAAQAAPEPQQQIVVTQQPAKVDDPIVAPDSGVETALAIIPTEPKSLPDPPPESEPKSEPAPILTSKPGLESAAEIEPTKATGDPVELVQAKMTVWQTSWQARDPCTFLSLFDASFPKFKSYSESRQKEILATKFIEVSLENVEYREEGDLVVVRFHQKYRSNTFRKDKTIKELVWRLTPQGPRIIEERFIQR
jgi:hypothetical protein